MINNSRDHARGDKEELHERGSAHVEARGLPRRVFLHMFAGVNVLRTKHVQEHLELITREVYKEEMHDEIVSFVERKSDLFGIRV